MSFYRIKDVARINLRTLPESTDPDYRFRYIDIGSVDSLGKITIPEEEISFAGSPSRARRLAPPSSVIVSTVRTYLRAVAPVPATQMPLIFSTGFAVLEATDKLDPRFLAYFCQSEPFIDEVVARSVGVSYPAINASEIGKLPIHVPDLHRQRRIADFLDAETARIDTVQQVTIKQRLLLSEQLSETVRIATTIGSRERQESGIPWMPCVGKEWRLFKISHAFSTGSGTTPTSDRPEYFDGPYPWINSADLNDGNVCTSHKSVTRRALREFSALKLYPPGSLVVAMYGQGATKGKVGILKINACLNQACCALVPNGCVDSEYAAYWFRAHKEGIVALAYGAGQPNLSQELIGQLRIPAPGISEQRAIVDQLRATEDEVLRKLTFLRRRENLLAERRKALITAAVTGQIDVSTASGRGIGD